MEETNFQCPLCQKFLATRWALTCHSKKKIPCNLQCPDCSYVSVSTNTYKMHIKTHQQSQQIEEQSQQIEQQSQQIEQQSQQIEQQSQQLELFKQQLQQIELRQTQSQQIVESQQTQIQQIQEKQKIVKRDDIDIIPIQDFQQRYQDVISTISEDENEIKLECVTKIAIERRETYIIRKRNARAAITNQMLCRTLEVMRPNKDINIVLENVMYDLMRHTDSRLHNIYLSDLTRGTVKIYTRNDEKNICYWQVHPKHIANKLINEHAHNMFIFLLDAGIDSLVSAILNQQSCLALNGIGTDDCPRSFVLAEGPYKGELKYISEVLTSELVYTESKDDRLINIVNVKRDDVLENLKRIILDGDKIQKCLQECRRFSFLSIHNK